MIEANMYGVAHIYPSNDVVVASYGTWTLTYTVGVHSIDQGGCIMVAWRHASNWGRPQTQDPSAPDYLTAYTSGNARLSARFDPRGYIRPWRPAVVVDVQDDSLREGDKIVIVYGDRSGGGPGSRVQTFVEETFEFRVLVDSFGGGLFVQLPDSPTLHVIAGDACRLTALAPSQAVAKEPVSLVVKAEDCYGNPSTAYVGTVALSSDENGATLPKPYTFKPKDAGVHRFDSIIFSKPGIHSLNIIDEQAGFNAVSNPVFCYREKRPLKLLWGDLHGQTESTIGTGSLDEYFRYGRDVAGLDFLSHAANDFQVTKEHYEETGQTVKQYHEPGRFVTFLAYEWSGNTPDGGDHNVYYLNDDQPIHRSSHWQVADKSDEDSDRCPLNKLAKTFRDRNDVVVIPHIGGRRANLDFYDARLMPFIEIASVHGRFEWFAKEALERGLKVGFVGGSDDHTGKPGAAEPTWYNLPGRGFPVRGGMMGVYADALTRRALWESFNKRHCYATTGERIILQVTSGGYMMGDEYATGSAPTLSVEAVGTAPVDAVEIIRGSEVIYTYPPLDVFPPVRNRLKIVWSGAKVKGRGRQTVWDGGLSIDKGVIISVSDYASNLSWQGITDRNKKSVKWRSSTSGDYKGIIVDFDMPEDAVITFNAGPVELSFIMKEVRPVKVVDAGGVEQKVVISQVPREDPSANMIFSYTDEEAKKGLNAYWVKVVQCNGEMAWSSPIFINYED
ncbi:DUF3604 domain-containing protein [Chloroflexota bacterium]